ncbi:hypothetical protein AAC691_17355 [Nguyenibacter vanlangensis]|uniref:Uncharacterized protein n=1 Tax=Nguyenibacter vanlangensis TaxID=1216886 RepID=A0ABZ3D2P1_9PROT
MQVEYREFVLWVAKPGAGIDGVIDVYYGPIVDALERCRRMGDAQIIRRMVRVLGMGRRDITVHRLDDVLAIGVGLARI